MQLFHKKLNNMFTKKQVVKIISGIDNTNFNSILKYIKTCEMSNATYVDIIANPNIISVVKRITHLPICVSSISIKALYDCVQAGADIIEIGNFDSFYNEGIILSASQILVMAKQARTLFPYIDICVTIPYTLKLEQQVDLAVQLEKIGINIIQTEGKLIKSNNSISNDTSNLYNSICYASLALSSVYYLSQSIEIPIIASSSINSVNANFALAYGASGIGIKSAIDNLSSIKQMSSYINEITCSFDINKIDKCYEYQLINSHIANVIDDILLV